MQQQEQIEYKLLCGDKLTTLAHHKDEATYKKKHIQQWDNILPYQHRDTSKIKTRDNKMFPKMLNFQKSTEVDKIPYEEYKK